MGPLSAADHLHRRFSLELGARRRMLSNVLEGQRPSKFRSAAAPPGGDERRLSVETTFRTNFGRERASWRGTASAVPSRADSINAPSGATPNTSSLGRRNPDQ